MRPWEALFRTDTGRIRLAWRLAGFGAGAALVAGLLSALLPGGLIWNSLALLVAALVVSWALLAAEGRGAGALGFHLSREAPSEAGSGVALGVGLAGVVVALMWGTGVLSWEATQGRGGAGWLLAGLAALLYLALPAAAEEAVLRGYPFQAAAEAWGPGGALGASAALFGLLHLANPGAGALATVNVAAAGLLLGVVYLRTASLWWATGVHLGWNWAHGYLADLPVSGLEVVDAPGYEGVSAGPAWLAGGSFGPEGSVASTLVLTVASAALWWGPWPRPGAAAGAHGRP